MIYDVFKSIHILGVVILLGNVTITAFWKVFSDMTRDPKIIAHAQKAVSVSDWMFTLAGIVLVLAGGIGAAYVQGIPLFQPRWLVLGEILFAVSGVIWLAILVPLQIRQARDARKFALSGVIPESYWRDGRAWLVWGIVATVPLIAATYVMIAKP